MLIRKFRDAPQWERLRNPTSDHVVISHYIVNSKKNGGEHYLWWEIVENFDISQGLIALSYLDLMVRVQCGRVMSPDSWPFNANTDYIK